MYTGNKRSALFALAIFALVGCAVASKQDEYVAKNAALEKEFIQAWNAPEFQSIRSKTTLGDSDISLSMTLNDELPTMEERQAMLKWGDKLVSFNSRADAMARDALPAYLVPLAMPIVDRQQHRKIDLTVAMYRGSLTWGKYNGFRVESAALKKKEMDELVATVQMANAIAASSAPAPPPRSVSSVEWFLLQAQQPAPRLPVTCNSFVRGIWISTTCF